MIFAGLFMGLDVMRWGVDACGMGRVSGLGGIEGSVEEGWRMGCADSGLRWVGFFRGIGGRERWLSLID